MNEYKYKLKDSVTDEMLDRICAIRAKGHLLRKTAGYCYESKSGHLVPASFVEETV